MSKDDYYKEAQAWETGDAATRAKSEKRAWWIVGGLLALNIAQGVSIAGLIPLHTVVPYVLQENETTGRVEVAKSLKDLKTTWGEVTRKADVRKYVRNRESYSRPLATGFYTTVGIMSSPEESARYQEFYNPKLNKKGTSPLQVYGEVGTVQIKIKSVSFINEKAASVNYIRVVREDQLSTTKPKETEWVATVTFRYGMPPANEDDREINSTGIQVVEYRNDPVNPNANEAN
jgi:type IV secretion system protein VirB8